MEWTGTSLPIGNQSSSKSNYDIRESDIMCCRAFCGHGRFDGILRMRTAFWPSLVQSGAVCVLCC